MKHFDHDQYTVTERHRIDILFNQSIASSLTSLATVITATIIFYLETQNLNYFFWAAVVVVFNVNRNIMSNIFLKNQLPTKKYHRWLYYYFASAAFSGLSWSCLLAINISPLSTPHQLLTFVIIAFVGFVGISSYSAVLVSFIIFITSLYALAVTLILLFQDTGYYSLILIFILTYPVLIVTARAYNRNIIESLTKQVQVEHLLHQVEDTNVILEEKVLSRTQELVKAKEEAEQATLASREFLANMTHELRTPLHAILSFSKLGSRKKETYSTDKMLEYFNKIHQSGDRLLELMENLLELSKFDAGKVELRLNKVSLPQTTSDILNDFEPLIQEKSIIVKTSFLDNDIEIMLDRIRIEQVIKNLLGNAIKFSPAGGRISISLELKNMITGRRDTDTKTQPAIMFSVSDEGIGIPATELDLIFDKFIQSSKTKTGAGGTGLGLAICKEIILSHSGKIWAENNSDKGAIFHFMVPLITLNI